MHKIDEFFTDSAGHGWGILIRTPATEWTQYEQALDSLRQTFQTTTTQTPSGPTALGDWPGGSGYTVILASKTSEVDARNVAARAAAAGLDAGVLDSSNFRSLRPGYWVAFTGVYPTQPAAAAAAAQARQLGFTDAYSRFVSP
jgi:hypothetical protein